MSSTQALELRQSLISEKESAVARSNEHPATFTGVLAAWIQRHRGDLIAICVLTVTLLGGAGMFWSLMGKAPNEAGFTNSSAWTYFNSLYFTVQMVCAVGYGDFSPMSLPVAGQVLLPFYSYFSRGVAWLALQVVPDVAESLLMGLLKRLCGYKSSSQIPWFTARVKLVATVSIMLLGATLGAFAFHALEGWSYGDSVYYSIVTLSTIGYGDFAPVTFHGRLFFIFFVLLQMGAFFHYLESFLEFILKNAAEQPSEDGQPLFYGGVRAWWGRNWRWIASLIGFVLYWILGAFLAYIFVGGAFITYNPVMGEVIPNHLNQTLPWTYSNSLYACLQIITTVDYADFVPFTPGGKAFVCIYAIGGLLVLTFTEAEIATRMLASGLTGFVIRLRKGGAGVISHRPAVPFTLRAQESYLPLKPTTKPANLLRSILSTDGGRCLFFALCYAGWCVLCGAVFSAIEFSAGNPAFTLRTAVFWTFQGITTGGFSYPYPGQYPQSGYSRIFWPFYVMIGLLCITAMLTAAGDFGLVLFRRVGRRIMDAREARKRSKTRSDEEEL
eukprot:TRINITY_DN888_c0_g1_i1.p1 TRINITY_DN888_c0_g1~~TRINITY_DN888_c0_g1_i1.p1  ORF type:complete len:555 (+),score=30.51 TRINITY_DN888_c0_g1_i1:1082-2746(+)